MPNNTLLKIGNSIQVFGPDVKSIGCLTPGEVYRLSWDPKGNLSLVEESPLTVPSDYLEFGQDVLEHTINSFNSMTEKNIGVLLSGQKGMGKSVLARLIAIKSNLPIVMINQSIPSFIDYTSFLRSLNCDLCLFIDEFEKLFPVNDKDAREHEIHGQNSILSYLDGISSSHRTLIILSVNGQVEDRLINRPSRIRYHLSFSFLNQEMFDEIIDRYLVRREFEQDLRDNLPIYQLTIDLAIEIIKEINLTNKPYSSFKSFFNFKNRTITYRQDVLKVNSSGQDEWVFDSMILNNHGELSPDNNRLGNSLIDITNVDSLGYIHFYTERWSKKSLIPTYKDAQIAYFDDDDPSDPDPDVKLKVKSRVIQVFTKSSELAF